MSSNQTSRPIAPAESGRSYVVVDLGGTQIRTAVFDVAGRLLTRRAITTPRTGGPTAVIAAILDQIQQTIAEHPPTVVAVGVSALGPVDPHTGTIANAPTLPGFENVPLGPRLQHALRLPVHVYNDANAATIAEWRLGAGRGTSDFCYVTVSTGIGCGIISNGELITGGAGYAGEFGRIRIPLADGATAQLEQLSSGTAIATLARALVASGQPTSLAEFGPHDITAGTVAAAARSGDEAALGLLTNAATTQPTRQPHPAHRSRGHRPGRRRHPGRQHLLGPTDHVDAGLPRPRLHPRPKAARSRTPRRRRPARRCPGPTRSLRIGLDGGP